MHRRTGQASAEYVALLSLLALALAVAGAAGPLPGIGRAVAAGVRHGVCVVAGGVCTAREARAAGLAPCPLMQRSLSERASGTVAVIRIERRDAIALERRSDGTATVSFLDGGSTGPVAGLGVQFTPGGVAAMAKATGGATFTAGRSWKFPSVAAAQRFVRRFASHESMGGELRDSAQRIAGRLCPWCPKAIRGEDPPEPRRPDVTYHEGGAFAKFTADVGLGLRAPGSPHVVGLQGEVNAAAILGRRVEGRRTTWYAKLDGDTMARFGQLIDALHSSRAATGILAVTSEGGRAVELRVTAAATVSQELDVIGVPLSLAALADRLAQQADVQVRTGRGPGRVLEAELALDLRDPANHAAARGLAMALRPGAQFQLPLRAAALGRRFAAAGTADLRLFDFDVTDREVAAALSLGPGVGASYRRVAQERRLLGAWSRPAGDGLREREDCTNAAAL